VEKPWVNFEAGAGWVRDIPVIPLCHSGIQPSNLPMPLIMISQILLIQLKHLKKTFYIAEQLVIELVVMEVLQNSVYHHWVIFPCGQSLRAIGPLL